LIAIKVVYGQMEMTQQKDHHHPFILKDGELLDDQYGDNSQ
jgi:hypothetical protein